METSLAEAALAVAALQLGPRVGVGVLCACPSLGSHSPPRAAGSSCPPSPAPQHPLLASPAGTALRLS